MRPRERKDEGHRRPEERSRDRRDERRPNGDDRHKSHRDERPERRDHQLDKRDKKPQFDERRKV